MPLLLADLQICVGVCFLIGGMSLLISMVSIVWKVLSVVWRFVVGQPDPAPRTARALQARCERRGCGELNWSDSHFCRRCGAGLPRAMNTNRRDAGATLVGGGRSTFTAGRKDDVDVRG